MMLISTITTTISITVKPCGDGRDGLTGSGESIAGI
jgi:hypothetical protein